MFVPKLNFKNMTEKEQFFKIGEELYELFDQINKDGEEKLEEAWDIIIATFNFMLINHTEEEIEEAYKIIFEKIRNRSEIGEIKIDRYVELK